MIRPTINDIGRSVIYQAKHPNAKRESGVITSYNNRVVFVRYGADTGSKGTDPRGLEWASVPP